MIEFLNKVKDRYRNERFNTLLFKRGMYRIFEINFYMIEDT